MRKFIAYYRVSSEEQRKGKLSIPTQQEDCRSWAQRNGVRIVEEFIESHSGRWPKARPVYEQALEYLRTNPGVEGIVVFLVNRLARNLTEGSTPEKQFTKLIEEIGELATGLAKKRDDLVMDGIGDAVVVLTILAAQRGVNIEACIDMAWDEIKDRKGRIIDGVFVKEDDLEK